MKPIEQLELWLNGESVHNDERDECCPDFSCCQPQLLADAATRQLFYDAYVAKETKVEAALLGGFLGGAISNAVPKKKVYLAGNREGAIT